MKSYRKELWFEAPRRRQLINITDRIGQCLEESGVQEGLLLANAMHITASVFINDDEAGLHQDFEDWLETLAPEKPHDRYRHNGYEDNADAHLKRTIMGREVVLAVTGGGLDLGPWEQVFYGEFDGLRRKEGAGQDHRRVADSGRPPTCGSAPSAPCTRRRSPRPPG